MPFSGNGGVRAMARGDFQATIYPGTNAGIQAALDSLGTNGGHVRLGPGQFTITNLTMYGKTTLEGSGAQNTVLLRDAAATGAAIREKTAGEGNSQGATGITLAEFSVWGNGTSGDGLDLGNQGGASLNANAQLRDLLVRDFTTGTAYKLYCNSIQCRNLWASANSVGFYLDGGASHYDGLWSEQNTDIQIRVPSPWNTFTHVHVENPSAGSNALFEIGVSGGAAGQAANNIIMGLTASLNANATHIIKENTPGCKNCQYFGIRVLENGFTFTNLLRIESESFGTGATVNYFPMVINQENSTVASYVRQVGGASRILLTPTAAWQEQSLGSMASATTITPGRGSLFNVTGNTTIDNIGAAAAGRVIYLKLASNPTIRHLAGGTGNIRCVGSVDLTTTANDLVQFISDGTNWYQSAPLVGI